LRTTTLIFVRAGSSAVALAAAAVLAVAAAGCGGGGAGAESERTAVALGGLYAIDHDGAHPTAQALAPYEAAFETVREECSGTVEELVSGIQNVAFKASNGSGTRITNLEALQAIKRYLDRNQPQGDDCRGIFVGVEAFLEGGALDGQPE
jgi:hypothetical protein